MGGSSHRIELLLVGVVLLLGSAFAVATGLPARDAPLPRARTASEPEVRMLVPALPIPSLPDHAALAAELPAIERRLTGAAGQIQPVVLAAAAALAGLSLATRALPASRLPGRARTLAVYLVRAWNHWRTRTVPRAHTSVAPLVVDLPALPSHESTTTDEAVALEALSDPPTAPPPPAGPRHPAHEWPPDAVVHTVTAALAREWRLLQLRSRVVALDVEATGGRALVLLEADATDGQALLTLPERLAASQPGWSARWRRGMLEVRALPEHGLEVDDTLMVPLLRHGRRSQKLRYLPIGGWVRSNREIPHHIGIYGAAAHEVLHACLASLLYAYPPEALALAVIESGGSSPTYAAAPHAVSLPGSPRATIAALERALRRGWLPKRTRQLVLAVIDPDEELLTDLARLVARLRQYQTAPLIILLAQRQPLAAGRELYAVLPACITAGGRADSLLLPGRRWPPPGRARLVVSGSSLEGLPVTWDEAEVHAALAAMTAAPRDLGPTLLDGSGVPQLKDPTPATSISLPFKAPEDALATRLARAFSGEPATDERTRAGDERTDACDQVWPRGPGAMSPAEVEALIRLVLVDPSIVATAPPGVTKGRLAALLAPSTRAQAGSLLAWLDHAGVLEEPRDEGLRWREPRLLRECEPEAIAARLRATPIPL
jgi:hypothetical protein